MNILSMFAKMRVGQFLLAALLFCSIAWAAEDEVPYLDENGKTQYCTNYTLLKNNTNVFGYLSGGCYVVGENVSYSRNLKFTGDVKLILVDNTELSVVYTLGGSVISATGSLKIYAQSAGDNMGALSVSTGDHMGFGLSAKENITINGGNIMVKVKVDDSHGLYASEGNIAINGGNVTVTVADYGKGIYSNGGSISINGGKVTASAPILSGYGLYTSNITLDYSSESDFIKASNYSGNVIIADGKMFMGGNNKVYRDTLTSAQLGDIKLTKLVPVVPYLDENGKTQYCTNFTLLTNNTNVSDNLPGGWYVVEGNVEYGKVKFNGDVNLILADGAELSVVDKDMGGVAFDVLEDGNLTIYAQSVGNKMGKLSATAVENDCGVALKTSNGVTINGGNVTATVGDEGDGIYAFKSITINGGNVTAMAGRKGKALVASSDTIIGGNVTATAGDEGDGIYAFESITINGGNVTALAGKGGYGLYAKTQDISLDYISATDFIKASNYYVSKSERVYLNMSFKDEDGVFYDEKSFEGSELSVLAGKTLRPADALKVDWNLEMGDIAITPEKLFKSFSGNYAFKNSVVSFTLNDGFKLVTTYYNDGEKYEILQTDGVYSFSMLANNVTVTVKVEKLLTHSDITVAEIPDQTYTGNAITPNITVKDGETELVENSDYELSYSDNKDVGSATVTITGRGDYYGTRTVSFTIAPKSIASEEITVAKIEDQSWTGNAIIPDITVKNGEAELVKDQDYTVEYSDNENAGIATVTIAGMGGYSDSKTVTFKIIKSLNSDGFTIEKIDDQLWTGEEIKPSVTMKDGSVTLQAETDFIVIYSNNIGLGLAEARIEGRGCYSGDTTLTFNIVKSIVSEGITVSEIADQKWTGEEIKPEFTIMDGETELVKDQDYTVEYSDNENAGIATVTITGKGNYFSSKTVTFKIIKSLEHESITVAKIEPQVYTGIAITPEFGIMDGEKALVKDQDYTLLYSNNVNVGTAKVTITGKGNYSDTKEVEFKIAKSIGNIYVSEISGQKWTGEEIKPEVSVMDKDDWIELEKGKDYELSYSDNKDVGMGKVIITGINGYVGSKTVFFRIYDPDYVVEYIDEEGNTQNALGCFDIVAADPGSTAGVPLTKEDGCYVVKGEVSYKDNFDLGYGYKSVMLILTDGAKLTVENNTRTRFITFNKLSIYAQSNGKNMGQFEVSSNGTIGLYVQKMTVNGGSVSVSGDIGLEISSYGSLTINGGVVNATSNGGGHAICVDDDASIKVKDGSLTAKSSWGRDIYTYGSLFLEGGSVVADENGIEASIPSTSSSMAYGVELAGATVNVASYNISSEKDDYGRTAQVSIANGIFYTDGEGNSFDGTLTDEQIAAISGKTIHSYIPALQIKEYTKSDGTTGILANFNANYNEIVPFEIKEMKVDSVAFTREFVTSSEYLAFATVMFPFDVLANNLEGVEQIVEFDGVNELYQVTMTSVWTKEKMQDFTLKAYTPYMLRMNESTLIIHGPVTIKTMEHDTYEVEKGYWKFVGTNVFKKWTEGNSELGRAYGYTTVNSSNFNAGEFFIIAKNAITRAFRAYVVETKPQAIAARKPFLSNAGSQTAVSSSFSTPDHLEVVIIEKDEEGKERTTVIGRFDTRTGEFKFNPVGDRVYDLKGRSIRRDAKKAKGVYYGKKAVKKIEKK